ncbi:MAG: hypothetical protein EOP50_06070 [Sphingobacteriales bacterium]|nr:MAG: hypothetical protein EOP50_06070 [Sphingobacteriales bacterium]
MKSTQLLACPSDSASPTIDMTNLGYPGYSGLLRRSYAMAEYLGEPDGRSIASIPVVAKTYLTVESNMGRYGAPADQWNYSYAAWNGTMIALNGNEWRHLDTTNFLYVDGHVKSQKRPGGTGPQGLAYHTDAYQKDANGNSMFYDGAQMPQS